MAVYKASVVWDGGTAEDPARHLLRLGEEAVTGSTAPEHGGNPACSNPEVMLLGALSSCHMLWFIAYARAKRHPVKSYIDEAEGTMDDDRFTAATLRPAVTFEGEHPGPEFVADLHRRSHAKCYIANSVNFPVEIEAQ